MISSIKCHDGKIEKFKDFLQKAGYLLRWFADRGIDEMNVLPEVGKCSLFGILI